jgi:hypothetical protein
VASGRERVRMLSCVAIERIYEHEVLRDAKLRKQAGARPLRTDARRLPMEKYWPSCAPSASTLTAPGWNGSASGGSRPKRSPARS